MITEDEDMEKELQNMYDELLSKNVSIRHKDVPFMVNHKGFTYKFVKYLKKDKKFRYVCNGGYNRHLKIENRCPATIKVPLSIMVNNVESIQIEIDEGKHTCIKESGTLDGYIKDAEIKKMMEDIYKSKTPRPTRNEILIELLKKLKPPIPMNLVSSYYTYLEKQNKKIDQDFTDIIKTKDDKRFELFKIRYFINNPPTAKFIICFCSDFQKSIISDSKTIFIDGTFDVVPEGWAQLLVILGQTKIANYPIAYMLLPNKSQETYEKSFTIFKYEAKCKFQKSTTFITDFERAEFNAVKKILMEPTHYFQHCYFHFTQIIRRKFEKYPKTKLLRRLKYIFYLLPFMPLNVVEEVINELYKYKETKKCTQEFENEFMFTYDFNDWNCFNKPDTNTVTNNVAESHNKILAQQIGNKLGTKPSFEQFITGIKEIEEEYRLKDIHLIRSSKASEEIKRIDQTQFKLIFRKFITYLKRGFYDEDDSPLFQNMNNADEFFFDSEEENTDLFEQDIPQNSDIIHHSDINVDSIIISDSETPLTSEVTSDSDSVSNAQTISLKRTETQFEEEEANEHRTRNKNANKKMKEKEKKTLITKASSRQVSNIRDLPMEIIEILKESIIEFINSPPRSKERSMILESTLLKVNEIDANITRTQVRSWFDNNKHKIK